jgi:serine/threonine protein kinase
MSSLKSNNKSSTKSYFCKRPSSLGTGSFGTVIKCSIDHPKVKTVAVKVLSQPIKSNNNVRGEKFADEKELGQVLSHNNIVKTYKDIIIDKIDMIDSDRVLELFSATPDDYRIIMEYCDEGDLFRIVNNMATPDYYSPETVKSIYNSLYYGIGSAICYLHTQGVVHNDIKEEYIYVRTEPGNRERFVLKLADFGKAYEITSPEDSPYTAEPPVIGTTLYAPLYFLKKIRIGLK